MSSPPLLAPSQPPLSHEPTDSVSSVCSTAAAHWLSNKPGIVGVVRAVVDRKVERVCPASTQALDDLNMKSAFSPSIAVSTCQG